LVDAALRLVTSFASFTVRGADGVSITLDRQGTMTTVASSDGTVRAMDEHQYATGEGPCLSAAAEGRWVHSPSLADEGRWPAFVPRAREEGIASIMSTPLVVATLPVGAINMYSRTRAVFGAEERRVSVFFAKRAAEILAASTEVDQQQGMRISEALTTREIISMAQGVHMSVLRLSADDAAAELYRSARTKEITVRAEALAVLESAGRPPTGTGGRDGP
jgi:signal transduction protein with GAF and PtsI domain